MQGLLMTIIGYLIVNTLIWVLRHYSLTRAKRRAASLDSRYRPSRPVELPKVSVLVAGKNEEKNIERCLRSLVAQEYPDLEIIAINDRSQDRTGEIMEAVARESHGRLRVVHVTDLPTGWLGKPHAMHLGRRIATGEYLLFTDADCFFQCPHAVRIGVEYAREKSVDLLSVLPVLETSSLWERILQPVCSAVMILWFQPEKVNNPAHSAAYANGAFMLFTRDGYERVGGHEQVREHLMEDMEFARRMKRQGLRLHVVQNKDLYRTRMYENFSATFAGWSRIFYGGFGKPGIVGAAALMVLVMSLLPYLILVAALGWATLHGWEVHRLGWMVFAWSALAILAQMSVILRFYLLVGQKWYRGLTYPAGAAVTFAILLSALKKFTGGKIVWRGSEIKHKNIRLAVEEKK